MQSQVSGRLPTKVLHVMNAAVGGAALSTLGLIDALQREHGVRSCVVCDDVGTQAEREALIEATGGETMFTPLYWWNRKIRVATWKRPALELRQMLRTRARFGAVGHVVRGARQWGAEVIHTNTILTPEGGRAAQLLGIGHVWHLRELIGGGHPFQLPLEGEALGRYLMAHASVVVANSRASAVAVQPLLPPERLEVIPNGIDLEAFSAIVPQATETVRVGMIANLTSRTKKHGLFIEAASKVKNARFQLFGHAPPAGSDAYADKVRAQAREAGVELMGFVEAAAVLRNLDILVHSADNESFGRTVVEAMAAGLPVVGVDGGGVAETIVHEQTGLLSPPDSADALASNIARLVGDPAMRKRFGLAGRARALDQYSLAACAKQVALVYQRALAAPVSSGWTILSLLGALP
jgi:glycosyltransferase involved in cell wall biosynthesis